MQTLFTILLDICYYRFELKQEKEKMLELRLYQNELINAVRASFASGHRKVLLVSPTGSGKTALTVHMMDTASKRGLRCMFLVHRNELLKQTSAAMWEQHLEHGQVKSGSRLSVQPVLVASIGTLINRLEKIQEPDLIIIDEAHRSASNSYLKVLEAYPGARVVGLTATPERSDGKGLGDIYSDLVQTVDVRELIDDGYLCDYVLLAPPPMADMKGVHTVAGDYNKKELAEITDKAKITGDAIAHYVKHATGKTCIVFCVTVEHSKHVARMYNDAGIPCEQLDGGHTDAERTAALDRVRTGETLVLTSVDLFIEGLNVPRIEVVQWLRKTKSLIVWRQGVGRGLRPHYGKERLIILDHVGNSTDLGFPDTPYEWTLEGSKSKKKRKIEPDVLIKQCPKCYAVYQSILPSCPNCGERAIVKPRVLETVEGELVEIERAQIKQKQKKEQGSARELVDLVKLGISRKMKDPAGWSAHIYSARQKSKPSMELKLEAKRIYRELK